MMVSANFSEGLWVLAYLKAIFEFCWVNGLEEGSYNGGSLWRIKIYQNQKYLDNIIMSMETNWSQIYHQYYGS
jgi:hypothetical protein